MIPGSASSHLLGAAAGATGYQVSRSLRFSSSDSSYLSRTFSSAGNRTTWTWSAWVKRVNLGSIESFLFQGGNSDFSDSSIRFSSDKLTFSAYDGTANLIGNLQTAQVFRDVSAWYHIVAVYDSGNSTADDRMRLYVNGSQITAFSSRTNPSQNAIAYDFNGAALHNIGSYRTTSNYLSAYLAEIHFIDGSAKVPGDFGETDATTGQWIPKLYSGSYGTNGFKLNFSDNSAATATTLGKDSAGSNNWTPNNFSVTAGAGNDSLTDTPTSYGTGTSGGDVRGNFCTLNPLFKSGDISLSNGNLDYTTSTNAAHRLALSTFRLDSGKWYWEQTMNTSFTDAVPVGICRAPDSFNYYVGQFSGGSYGLHANGDFYYNGTYDPSYNLPFGSGDVIGVAFDADAGTLTFYKNGVSGGQATSGATGGGFFPAVSTVYTGQSASLNFGQRAFAYTPPANYKALVDTNLPSPTVAKGNTAMDVALWSGNNTSGRSISGLNTSPDFVWIKCRSTFAGHILFDSVRGAGKSLRSFLTDAEVTNDQFGYVSQFNNDGFTLTAGSYSGFEMGDVNMSGRTYVGWVWDAGSSTVTNTQGSITSSVRANASAGFSIITYTGTATSNQTVGHGLGVAPALIIAKSRGTSGPNWVVYHQSLGKDKTLVLNNTDAEASITSYWGTSSPSSTVFGVGQGNYDNNRATTMVAYAFSPVAGYSSMSSFVGNGLADGVFVYTGFRPKWVLIKASSTASTWTLQDSARSSYNVADARLFADTSEAEVSNGNGACDFLSNGFKIRTSHGGINSSGATYIYAAFAENPFQYARAR